MQKSGGLFDESLTLEPDDEMERATWIMDRVTSAHLLSQLEQDQLMEMIYAGLT